MGCRLSFSLSRIPSLATKLSLKVTWLSRKLSYLTVNKNHFPQLNLSFIKFLSPPFYLSFFFMLSTELCLLHLPHSLTPVFPTELEQARPFQLCPLDSPLPFFLRCAHRPQGTERHTSLYNNLVLWVLEISSLGKGSLLLTQGPEFGRQHPW